LFVLAAADADKKGAKMTKRAIGQSFVAFLTGVDAHVRLGGSVMPLLLLCW
jgi:hypothetical protein